MKGQKEKSLQYFFTMGEYERKLVEDWYLTHKLRSVYQEDFFKILSIAIEMIEYDYRIATIEPSVSNSGKIYYKENSKVGIDLYTHEWRRMAIDFAPEHKSDIASIYELYMWYAYRVAVGYWSVEYICDDSSFEGNYSDSPNASLNLELSGIRKIGNYCDGIGNTYKLVKDEKIYLLCGGCYDSKGSIDTITKFIPDVWNSSLLSKASAVVVLRN